VDRIGGRVHGVFGLQADKHPHPAAARGGGGEVIKLTKADLAIIVNALISARTDIWQTARVSEGNLTGRDPTFPDDKPTPIPVKPRLVTRAGIDESYAVIEQISAALRIAARAVDGSERGKSGRTEAK
jgi:hypothetical protein